MKSGFLISFAFFISLQIFGQDFAPIGAKWYYSECFFDWRPIDIDYLSITAVKDTLIQNVMCRKLSKRHKPSCSNRPIDEYVFSRNDSVFFYDQAFDEFQLLYDFNAVKYDLWIIKVKNGNQQTDTVLVSVDSISTIRLNETDLKKLYVTYSKNKDFYLRHSIIIEKLGEMGYMFGSPWTTSQTCDGNSSQGLRCYQDNEFGVYSTGIASSCDYIHVWTDISTKESVSNIKIYPNPTQGIIDIISSNNYNSIIIITDILGKPIFQKKINIPTQLDLSLYPKGLYFLTIQQNYNTIFNTKIIKY